MICARAGGRLHAVATSYSSTAEHRSAEAASCQNSPYLPTLAISLVVLLFVLLYWSCNQKIKVPSRLQPRPGSRADVTVASDLPEAKLRNPPCAHTGMEKPGSDQGGNQGKMMSHGMIPSSGTRPGAADPASPASRLPRPGYCLEPAGGSVRAGPIV